MISRVVISKALLLRLVLLDHIAGNYQMLNFRGTFINFRDSGVCRVKMQKEKISIQRCEWEALPILEQLALTSLTSIVSFSRHLCDISHASQDLNGLVTAHSCSFTSGELRHCCFAGEFFSSILELSSTPC